MAWVKIPQENHPLFRDCLPRDPRVSTVNMFGGVAAKVNGQMFVCLASHKSAEPGTLVVRMDVAARNALVEEEPATYYLTEHYVGYPCVLVRLARVDRDALRDLVLGAHRFVRAHSRTRPARGGASRARGRSGSR